MLSLGASDTATTNRANVVFKPVVSSSVAPGEARLDLNGYSLALGGIDSLGVVSSDLIVQNGSSAASSTLTVGTDNAAHTFGGLLRNGNGAGTLALSKVGSATLTLSGASTYTGGTTIAGGTLAAGDNAALGTGAVMLSGGTLQASGAARILGNAVTLADSSGLGTGAVTTANAKTPGLTLTGAVTIAGDGALTVTGATRVAITGVVAEDSTPRTLVKAGAGTLVLTSDNTYTGGTVIRAGTLVVNNALGRTPAGSGTGEGAVTVARGGTLTGQYVISGATQVNSGGTLAVGNSIGQSQVGSLNLSGGSLLDFEIGGDGVSSDRLDISGLLSRSGTGTITFSLGGEHFADGGMGTLSEGTFTLLTYGTQAGFLASDFSVTGLMPNWTSTFALTGVETGKGSGPGALTVTLRQTGVSGAAAAPEPGSLVLLGTGCALALWGHRRKGVRA